MKNNQLMQRPSKMPENMSEYFAMLDTAETYGYNRAIENVELFSQAYNYAVINSEGETVESIIEKARKIAAFLNPPAEVPVAKLNP